ncbi:hypothetical protein [Zobellella denitrificans]|uniref:hypothetical protein n=1 Tax=Zobellella denitrificans TaxID=347534 RepID=UPI0012FD60FF|nr:hypothetical protein [Zobellella denitrificans]
MKRLYQRKGAGNDRQTYRQQAGVSVKAGIAYQRRAGGAGAGYLTNVLGTASCVGMVTLPPTTAPDWMGN